jgi:hypothetical protein
MKLSRLLVRPGVWIVLAGKAVSSAYFELVGPAVHFLVVRGL